MHTLNGTPGLSPLPCSDFFGSWIALPMVPESRVSLLPYASSNNSRKLVIPNVEIDNNRHLLPVYNTAVDEFKKL